MKTFAKIFGLLLAIILILGIAAGAYAFFNGFFTQKLVDVSKADLGSFQTLQLQLSAVELRFVKGDTVKVTAQNVQEGFSCTNKEGVLLITGKGGFAWFWGEKSLVTITLPENQAIQAINMKLNACKAELGALAAQTNIAVEFNAGSLAADMLQAGTVTLKMNAGSMELAALQADTATINLNAGGITLSGMNITALTFTGNAGSASLQGSVKSAQIKVNAGSAELRLLGVENDYSIIAKRAAGKLTINGQDKQGQYGPSDAERSLNLDVSAGAITVNFAGR